MSTAMPQVPPRPTRTQAQDQQSAKSLGSEFPKVPPRPNRRPERSVSPYRESFARSPLNEAPGLANTGYQTIYSSASANASNSDLPRRPPSVVLPSLGQEGSEYEDAFSASEDLNTSSTQTRNVATDLKLHAPKPSLPTSSAKARVSAVTRTDSSQAAAFGIGKAGSDDKDASTRSLKKKPSVASELSNGTERPPSSMDGEHGIPEIGQRVPMYPNAGDVQAPSPAPLTTPYTPGIGFHNDGTKPRHHGRRTSGRGFEGPPDSYGLHGHGVVQHDRFEKLYYEKHPELFKKEINHRYQEDRAEWALSSEDLNKIVRDTASRGAGLGTSPAVMGTPTEQIGFQASEEYTSRMSSPHPYKQAHSNASQVHVDSPLRKESFPADASSKAEFVGTLNRSLNASSTAALESETEDDEVIHVDDPSRLRKVYSASFTQSAEDLGPGFGEASPLHEEHGYSAPILASDEVAKEPFGWELQPAVSPLNERRGSHDEAYHHRSGSASSISGSRPTSRPGSIHGTIPGLRLGSDSKPLEDLNEYEPLFPEEEASAQAKKAAPAIDRLRRPEVRKRKFPSQDIWEDTPNSLQYTATVSTPQLPEDEGNSASRFRAREGETPEQAFARKQEELAEAETQDPDSYISREKKPWSHKSLLTAETRPGMKQRFPSRDIWEDTPDSLQLQTTVGGPQSEEKDTMSTPSDRPTTGAMTFHQEKAAAGTLDSDEGRATTGMAAITKPPVPARPARSKAGESADATAPPAVPERPQRSKQVAPPDVSGTSPPVPMKAKPIVPARPAKPVTRTSSENIPLTQIPSNSSAKSIGSDSSSLTATTVAAASKPKPPVPSRPVGSKIAALQGGFMSDLNKRLQLGPQAPIKKEEPALVAPEQEKAPAPLADARKGRARGPARRAPAKSPAPSTEAPVEEKKKPVLSLAFAQPSTLWHIDPEEDVVQVVAREEPFESAENVKDQQKKLQEPQPEESAPPLATNTAGEKLEGHGESPADEKEEEKEVAPPVIRAEDVKAEKIEDVKKEAIVEAEEKEAGDVEPVKESDELAVKERDVTAEESQMDAPAVVGDSVPSATESKAVKEDEE